MPRFFGNDVSADLRPELWLDAQRLQELYNLHHVRGYGQVAPNLGSVVTVQHSTSGHNAEDKPVPKK